MYAVKLLNSSVLSIDEILIGTTILVHSGPGSNVNESVLPTVQSSRTGDLVSYPGYSASGLTSHQRCSSTVPVDWAICLCKYPKTFVYFRKNVYEKTNTHNLIRIDR